MLLAVMGGGEFGTYHARQLLKARLPAARIAVVDRDPDCRAFTELAGRVEVVLADWLGFLRGWLPSAEAGDRLIPAPLAPHLLWEWLAEDTRRAPAEAPRDWGLPYQVAGPSDEVYLSAAAWMCPATCIEPRHCPVLHAPRDWDLAELIEARAQALGCEPAVFRCVHFAMGVGAIEVGEIRTAAGRLRAAPGRPAMVATSSRCHAAVGLLQPVSR